MLYAAVQSNCHISDGEHAQRYGLCTYLLKMREFYRWEKQLPFTRTLSNKDIGDWLTQREELWSRLEGGRIQDLSWGGENHSPFECDSLNQKLLPHGLVYSGGYGRFAKPLFFIGRLLKHERCGDTNVFISGEEYAREIAAPPAMSLPGKIFIRRECVRRSLWEQMEEWNWRQDGAHYQRLQQVFGFRDEPGAALESMTDLQVNTMLAHEKGELQTGGMLGEEWETLLFSVAGGKAELILRAVRDNLADCLVTLPMLLDNAEKSALLLYFSAFKGMQKSLFPELAAAYQTWLEKNSDKALRDALKQGQKFWYGEALEILAQYRKNHESIASWLEQRFHIN